MNEEKLIGKFFTGINYWALKNATEMWKDFDAESIDEDMQNLADAGVTHLRIFPMWPVFQPLHAKYTTKLTPYELCFENGPLPDTEAGRAGVSEEACQKFEVFCDLAEKHQLKLVVGLITGHMSFGEFQPPAFEGKHRISDPTLLKWQRRFVQYFIKRFKDRPCIAGWDLGNEVNNMAHDLDHEDDFYVWCAAISDAARAVDSEHPIVSGLGGVCSIESSPNTFRMIEDTCDIHTAHPYQIFQTPSDPLTTMKSLMDIAFSNVYSEDLSHVPTFLQEFGSIGYLNNSRKTEAQFYRAVLYTALAHNCHGVMWWDAFDQGHLRFPPYNWNNIGSDYGFYDKNRKAKPIVDVNLEFNELLKMLPDGNIPKRKTDGVILVQRDDGSMSRSTIRSSWILAKRAGLDLSFSYALDPIPDAPLYVFPSINANKPITGSRLDELLDKVAAGAILYMSLDNTLFRNIPEITGVQTAWRECVPSVKTVTVGEESFKVHSSVSYAIESADAEVLGRDEEGTPVFFARPYGKGKIFFLMVPLERSADQDPGAFWKDDCQISSCIYKTLADALHPDKAVSSDSAFIQVTEHPVDDRYGYLVFVNYSEKERSTVITCHSATLEHVFGGTITDGCLTLRPDDGAVYRYRKN